MKTIAIAGVLMASMCAAEATGAKGFCEEDVSVLNIRDSIKLAGTITTPAECVPRAAIVLATGSGAQNRDEEIMGHRPFKVIGETLAEQGYAVLRMDDRGTASSEGDFSTATTEDLATDIAAGLAEMRHRFPDIPAGIIGHSEGGTIAIREGAENPDCSFIITLAAPAWAGDSIIMSQSRALATALTGRWDGEALQREILDIVKSDLSDLYARVALNVALNKAYGEASALPQVKETIAQQLKVLLSPWYRGMVRYNPAAHISSVKKPWLALNGSSDTQVLPANLKTIKALNTTAETDELPGLNHLFQHCTTGLVNEYATIGEDIAPEVIARITSWLTSTLPTP